MGSTISAALRKASTLKNKISEVDQRLRSSTLWLEEEAPVWKFQDLIAEREKLVSELVSVKAQIAKANATTHIDVGGTKVTLSQAILQLAELKGLIALYGSLPSQNEEKKVDRRSSWEPDEHDYSRRVKVETVTITHAALTTKTKAEKLEELKALFNTLNDLVEWANHSTTID